VTKNTQRTHVERSSAGSYAEAGSQHFEIAEIARGKRYWTPAGVLYVHAAISYADAVAIHLRAEKSTSANHMDAVHLFDEATKEVRGQAKAVQHLRRVIDKKTWVSYTGMSSREADLEQLALHAKRFRIFTEALLRA
jgi:hypothetical protein